MYRPLDVTSHLTVSISVFRRHKCCASRNNAFYMFLCLTARPAFTINCLLRDVHLMIIGFEWFILSSCYYTLRFSFHT